MTVHTAGPITVAPDDLRIVHRGREVALKIIAWGNTSPVLAVCENKAGSGAANYIAWSFDDRNDGVPGMRYEAEIAEDGGVIQYVKKRLLPAINAILALMFKASEEPPPTPPPGELPVSLQGIDQGLQAALTWAPQPDGTLRVDAV